MKAREEYYVNAVKMAREIVDKLGDHMISDCYYSDDHYGNEYVNDQLTIYDWFGSKKIIVQIAGDQVASYNYEEKKISYKTGRWPELIEAVYDLVPDILNQKKKDGEERLDKLNEIKLLIPYFKDYINLDKKGIDTKKILKQNMSIFDIDVQKEQRYSSIAGMNQDYEHYIPYTAYTIIYDGKRVCDFLANSFEPIKNFDSAIDHFKTGRWIKKFKYGIINSKTDYERLLKQKTNNNVDEMIKKLKRNY